MGIPAIPQIYQVFERGPISARIRTTTEYQILFLGNIKARSSLQALTLNLITLKKTLGGAD